MYKESHLTLFFGLNLARNWLLITLIEFKLCQVNCQVNNSNDCQVICTSTTV